MNTTNTFSDADSSELLRALAALTCECAEAVAKALLDDSEDEAAHILVRRHGDRAVFADDGNCEVEMTSDSLEEAAEKYVAEGDWSESKSTWVIVYAWERWTLGELVVDGERESFEIEIKPQVPSCHHEDGHEWVAPHAVLGGLRENPGVWGHGGGAIVREICRHCGCLKTTDTWAQNPETGEQGLLSVEYEVGGHDFRDAFEEWDGED